MNDDKTSTAVNSITGNLAPKRRLPNARMMIIVALILLLAAIVLFVVYKNSNDDKQAVIQPSNENAVNPAYSVPGTSAGQGLSFVSSSNLQAWYNSKDDPNRRIFLRYTKPENSKNTVYVARLAAESLNYPAGQPTEAFLKGIKANLKSDPSSESFKSDTRSLKQFTKWVYAYTGMDVTLGKMQVFTNDAIKRNAYQYPLTGHDSSGEMPDQRGVMLWISGKKTYYHFMILADSSDWQKNQDYYQKVLNSITIDR